MPKDLGFKRIIERAPGSLRQIDIWWLGFLIGVNKDLSEDVDNKQTSKAVDNVGTVMTSQRFHLIEAVYLQKNGFDHQFDTTIVPAQIMKFGHQYAFAGMRILVENFNKSSDLGQAFLWSIETNDNATAGLQLE